MDAQGLYRQQSVETASPARLISMLFHGAIQRVELAEQQLRTGTPDEANATLQHVQAIVLELHGSLDRDNGGQIAENLASLYVFCLERLVEANSTKDPSLLPAVRDTLAGLVDAWDRMAETHVGAVPATG